jgi:acyl dehydratase
LEVDSSYAGSAAMPRKCEVTARHAMNFAAAIGDHNPWYFDDEREGGIIAPPLLSASFTWPFGGAAATHWDPQRFPLHLLARQVHYVESVDFHRMMRPGDRLQVDADLATVMPHRAGTYCVIRCVATDPGGERVFTEYAGTLLLGVRCTDKGAGVENNPVWPRKRAKGNPLWEKPQHVDTLAAHVYDGCADIYNPIHTSKRFAKSVGLPDTILHGTCTLSYAVRDVVDREADRDPTRLQRVCCRFTGMVFMGTDIRVAATEVTEDTDAKEVFFHVTGPDGKRVISDGYVRLAKD